VAGAHPVQARLGAGDGVTGTLGGAAAPAGTIRTYRDNTSLMEPSATANPNQAVNGRLVFLSAPLATDLRLSGIPATTLRVRVNRPTTELTVRLVDYGVAERIDRQYSEGVHLLSTKSCWGDSTPADQACYLDAAESLATTDLEVISRGWQDAAHGRSLQVGTPLQPNTWYTITVPMQATDTLLRAGHVLGLVLQQSDPGYTGSANAGDPALPSATDATVELDLHDSSVTLPQIGPAGLPAVGSPPRLSTVGAGVDANPPPHRLPPS
jgi:X-Pro dipeptidyl-peptidase